MLVLWARLVTTKEPPGLSALGSKAVGIARRDGHQSATEADGRGFVGFGDAQSGGGHARPAVSPGLRRFELCRHADQQVLPAVRGDELHTDWQPSWV